MLESENRQSIALKEWAVALKALREGKLIMVLRKGGIVEETKDFQLLSHHFYLMPAYEHQRKELLKEPFRSGVDETLAQWSPHQETISLHAYAEVVRDIEIRDQETLDKLGGLHIWTDTFAEERLKWKRSKPLHLLVLRVYELERPIVAPMRPAYTGCRSWVRLEDKVDHPALTPVLNDAEFAAEVAALERALGE